MLGGDLRLGLADFAAAGTVPEFIYLGAVHTAALALPLLALGARAVVAVAGAVDDDHAAVFADAFYSALQAGQALLQATEKARTACFQRFADADVWGRFQVWGDPGWKLVDDVPPVGSTAPAAHPSAAQEPSQPAPQSPQQESPQTPTPLLALPALADCAYTAYVAHAQADDLAPTRWVTEFSNTLEHGLASLLRGMRPPPMYLPQHSGPVAGTLENALRDGMAKSFAMILVVSENAVRSDWCLKELETFHALFGDAGLRERLFVVVISRPAIDDITRNPGWQRLLPSDQVWLPFYRPPNPAQPLDIYVAAGVLAQAFGEQVTRLRKALADRINASAVPAAPAAPAASPAPAAGEPDPERPAQAADGKVAVLLPPPSGLKALEPARQRLIAQGIELNLLTTMDIYAESSDFARARRLVLPFSDAPSSPTSEAGSGGQLGAARETWLKLGRSADHLLWLDLRREPPPRDAWRGDAAWVASLGVQTHGVEDLAKLLRSTAPTQLPASEVRLYIESNRHEPTLWETLGESWRRRWDLLFGGNPEVGVLRARALPIDDIARVATLANADGVVLLWGQKEAESLVSQINTVEPRLPGPDAAPGTVVRLMPPHEDTEALPVRGWRVLRVRVDGEAVEVVADEQALLDRFLLDAVNHERRRRKLPPIVPQQAAASAPSVASASKAPYAPDAPNAPNAPMPGAARARDLAPLRVTLVSPTGPSALRQRLLAEIEAASPRIERAGFKTSLREVVVVDEQAADADRQAIAQAHLAVLLVEDTLPLGMQTLVDEAQKSRAASASPAPLLAWIAVSSPLRTRAPRPQDAHAIENFAATLEQHGARVFRYRDGDDLARSVQGQIDDHLANPASQGGGLPRSTA